VVVEIPHAGTRMPEGLPRGLPVSPQTLLRDSDLFVDRLWDLAPEHGATLLVAHLSRYVVDLNRAPDDVELEVVPDHPAARPAQARGVVWRATSDGAPVLSGPLSFSVFKERIETFHAPYHQALEALLDEKVERFGFAILIAAHSMPSASRDGGVRRADVVPGTRGRTSSDPQLIDLVERHYRAAGLQVRHDDPYRGGFTTEHYGRPAKGVHAIQIELNRALYAEEATSRPREREITWLRTLSASLLDRLGRVSLPRL
jgi:N-formylglutamate deformylase